MLNINRYVMELMYIKYNILVNNCGKNTNSTSDMYDKYFHTYHEPLKYVLTNIFRSNLI